MKFLHVGIPTKEVKAKEVYIKKIKVYCTNPQEHPYSIEYFRCEESSFLPEIVKSQPHIAYEVEDIEEIIKEVEEVLVEPFELDGKIIAYVIKESLITKLCQNK